MEMDASKYYAITQLKKEGTAFLFWFFLGAHYAYLNKWGVQMLYWITLGGFGIWMLIDLFRIKAMVKRYNEPFKRVIDEQS